MARSLLLTSAVAAAVFGVSSAEFLKVSFGGQVSASTVATNGCGYTTGTTPDAICLNSANTVTYKWTVSGYSGGKLATATALAAASSVTTSFPAAADTNFNAQPTSTKVLAVAPTNAAGDAFIAALSYQITGVGAVDVGIIASVTSAGAITGLVGSGKGLAAANTVFKKSGVDTFEAVKDEAPKAENVLFSKTLDGSGGTDTNYQVPPVYSMACNGGSPGTAGAMICLAENKAGTNDQTIVAIASGSTATKFQLALVAAAASANSAGSITTGAGAPKKIGANGKLQYVSGQAGFYLYSDKNMIRYAKVAAAALGNSALPDIAPEVGTCDAVFNAQNACGAGVTAATINTAYGTAYGKTTTTSGLAMSVATAKSILSFFAAADGKTIILVDQTAAPDANTAGSNNIVRCTYTTFATDAGSSCATISTVATDKAATLTAMTDLFKVADPSPVGRHAVTVYGFGNLKKAANVETVAIGAVSRTVTPQTPAPNCKRNGRKYCTKTKTLIKAAPATNTTTNTSTNASTNGTKTTTTTTTSASAPLLASAWAMVGVVAALIAA